MWWMNLVLTYCILNWIIIFFYYFKIVQNILIVETWKITRLFKLLFLMHKKKKKLKLKF